jgi:hypothetical protein
VNRRPTALTLTLLGLVVAACGGADASVATSAAPSASSEAATPSPTAEPTVEPAPSEPVRPSAPPSADASSTASEPTELDWQLAPNFGSTELTSGFAPDPHEQPLTSGGPIDVSYLGGGCLGWATAAPDFDVTYEAGSMTLLRFYFVADEAIDTTLVINGPDGEWYCNDDAPGTIDPMVDFTSPRDGLYDVWVGSYREDQRVEGTLFVTELPANAP